MSRYYFSKSSSAKNRINFQISAENSFITEKFVTKHIFDLLTNFAEKDFLSSLKITWNIWGKNKKQENLLAVRDFQSLSWDESEGRIIISKSFSRTLANINGNVVCKHRLMNEIFREAKSRYDGLTSLTVFIIQKSAWSEFIRAKDLMD